MLLSRLVKSYFFQIGCLLLALICSTSSHSAQSASQFNPQSEEVVFGIAPWDNEQQLNHRFKPFIDLVAQQLKRNTRLVITRDYSDLARQLQSGNIHIGFTLNKSP